MEQVSWVKDCEICNNGLCARVEDLKDEGKSIREATRIMANEVSGDWDAGEIRSRYNYHSNRAKKRGRKSTTLESPQQTSPPEEATAEVSVDESLKNQYINAPKPTKRQKDLQEEFWNDDRVIAKRAAFRVMNSKIVPKMRIGDRLSTVNEIISLKGKTHLSVRVTIEKAR